MYDEKRLMSPYELLLCLELSPASLGSLEGNEESCSQLHCVYYLSVE